MQISKESAALLAALLWAPGCLAPRSDVGRPAQVAMDVTVAAACSAPEATIKRISAEDLENYLWLDFDDDSSFEFIGFSSDRAYLERRDRGQNEDRIRVLWVYTKDLDSGLVRDLQRTKAEAPNRGTAVGP